MIIFDAHFHIIDDAFPIYENNGYMPPVFKVKDYLNIALPYNINGGAIVSGSFQKFDQRYLTDALEKLGPNYVGVTQLPFDTSDEEILRLDNIGVRAIRFNVKRGGSEEVLKLEILANRVFDLAGWHTELYIDAKEIGDLEKVIAKLPKVSIDHLGLSQEGVPTLLRLVEKGLKVKATGFGRVELDLVDTMKKIININPDSLMFGTDLPSTRAKRPFHPHDIELIHQHFEKDIAEKIFYKNGCQWYGLKEVDVVQ
ncbi:amidohydrolase family protein [Rummeliibacillus pycnus]|uniref:amidohydrolase family protein n=1 Tax=Rummeliibacillus pycnus TaxID=101070 RepID=UPI000C9B3E31|nr:amidohydrolase family protein [Rummeliibacillus pycnus]